MYVLIIGRGYPSDKYKLNGIFEFDQAKALQSNGVKIVYAAIDARSIRRWRKWGLEQKLIQGITVYTINIPLGGLPKWLIYKIMVVALRKLYERIAREQGVPDLIHAHFISTGYVTAKAFSDSKIPMVLTEHYSAMNQQVLTDYYMKLGRSTYSRMDQVISVSQALSANINEKFGINSVVIPNVVDLTNFSYPNQAKTDPTKSFIFVSVGNLKPNKKMDLLISSFYQAFENDPKVSLYIFGDGAERSNLEQLIEEYHLSQRVFLMGTLDRSVIASQMAKSDGFVLVSESETFGLAYIEALASGLPVIATTSGGPEEFVNETNGILISVNDEDHLIKALKQMVETMDRYDKQRISQGIKEEFSEEHFVAKLTKVYEAVLKSKVR